MKYSVLTWNVEHFKNSTSRIKTVADSIAAFKPDIFAIFETEELNLPLLIRQYFPNYNFYLTDGPETQEIMLGVKDGLFTQVVFTQKREFDVGNSRLRPGALLNLKKGVKEYNHLFLHMDSGTDAAAFGNRFEMFDKIENLIKALQRADANANLVVAGDFNTMGMFFPDSRKASLRVSDLDEIDGVGKIMQKLNLQFGIKNFATTWKSSSSGKESNLDHVLHTSNLKLKNFGNLAGGGLYQVQVKGWHQLTGAAQQNFLLNISDHCMLYFEIDD
jgi:Endonuclease/Exonuclease/phosphatase family